MEKSSLPLNDFQARKTNKALNRLHAFIHGAALLALFYYRITSITAIAKSGSTRSILVPHFLILVAEVILSFIWLLSQASKWNPIVRTAYPERLPHDDRLPSLDVFVCTADSHKEPSLGVMNTVISAMALDYPPNKLHVYLSDDGGSHVTLLAMREAWSFAKVWIPFCRKFEVKTRCPQAYFFREEQTGEAEYEDDYFVLDKRFVENAYKDFKICLAKIVEQSKNTHASRDHPPIIEIIKDAEESKSESDHEMPLLVYVAREKRPSHPHHFKAGALNVLLRVSGVMSNSPYILVLDCDMYCNDPMSARQAMCFHLDPKLSPILAFVQYPQKFHNLSEKDIYDGELRYAWEKYEGLDGLRGPILSGTGFFMKRDALYGPQQLQNKNVDLIHMEKCFGSAKEFIKTIDKSKHGHPNVSEKELQLLASCSYEDGTEWGEKVGFRYYTVVEDVFTGLNLHCEGYISVYYGPSRACFLGESPVSLGEVLVQHARWGLGLNQISFSKFTPLLYGSWRMSILQSMAYADVIFYPLFFLPLYILALVPQICLLRGIALFPQISSPFFLVFVFVFVSAQAKHVQEVLIMGYSIRTSLTEQRVWMFRSLTSYFFANLNTIMDKIGLIKASFLPTNKVADEGADKLYQKGIYNFEAPNLFMVPLCTLYIINLASFLVGFGRILFGGERNEMLIEAFIPLFGIALHFPLLEGMVLRKDNGRVPSNVSLISAVVSSILVAYVTFPSNY